jgi:hypothetical protein
MIRCGNCDNCKELEKVKTSVLRCCGTPKNNGNSLNHADDGVVMVWNQRLAELPCQCQKTPLK